MMRVRKREKIQPIHMISGDTIKLSYKEEAIDPNGTVMGTLRDEVVLEEKIDRNLEVDEAVIFDVEPGEFGENVEDGIGGAFLKTKRKGKQV